MGLRAVSNAVCCWLVKSVSEQAHTVASVCKALSTCKTQHNNCLLIVLVTALPWPDQPEAPILNCSRHRFSCSFFISSVIEASSVRSAALQCMYRRLSVLGNMACKSKALRYAVVVALACLLGQHAQHVCRSCLQPDYSTMISHFSCSPSDAASHQ